MSAADGYVKTVTEKIENLLATQKPVLESVALAIFKSLTSGDDANSLKCTPNVWHLFGAGHSHMVVEEAFHRAGGLIPINPWLEEYLMPHAGPSRNGPLERLSGLAKVIFDFYKPQAGEVITIISNSGINATSVEMAEHAKKAGLITVAITNIEHSKKTSSRHVSGKKLYELCDHVIDSGGIPGDAVVKIQGLDVPVGPLSTILGSITVNYLSVRVCEYFSESGKVAPVYLSANLPGGDERNKKLEQQYKSRISRLQ
ncbi:MAG: SIS domain-containing protein [Oligoflexia bacterium]|nr:SIS domain-containing protein [Oligoflexia bacterium]